MKVLSVIDRELRVSARHSFTYSMRVLAVVALLVVLGLFCLNGDLGPEIGERLFGALHCALFFAIWGFAPLLTADCISSERREGTLPLLFLTNLEPRDIVFAKGFAHGLRAFTLWLAVLPVLAVPLVAGGVGYVEVMMSVMVNAGSLCLATAAGVVASASTRVWTRSLVLAMCLAVLFFTAFLIILPMVTMASMLASRAVRGLTMMGFGGLIRGFRPEYGLGLAMNWDGTWQQWVSSMRAGAWPLLRGFAAVTLGCVVFLFIMIRFAAWRVRGVWREQPSSARVEWLKKQLFTPVVFARVLRRWLDWQLQRNPIGWLEQRTWSGRLIVWSWTAVVICIYSTLFTNLSVYQRGFGDIQNVMASLLAGCIALSAAGSFRRERESGLLELLLVSPIREWQIIGGRVRGLWMQFLPAMALLFSVWLYCATFLTGDNQLLAVVVFANAFATLPVIGLYFSLTKANFLSSVIWTLLSGVVLPAAVGRVAAFWFDPMTGQIVDSARLAGALFPCLVQILMAVALAWRLHHRLRYRKFSLERKALN